jgi:hypothetical protein
LPGVDTVERKIGRDDITYLNIVGMIENHGYSIRDNIYCGQFDGKDVLVQNNAIIYDMMHMFEASKVLNLSVKRKPGATVNYVAPVMFDFLPPVDNVGT